MFKRRLFNVIVCIITAILLPFSSGLFKVNAQTELDGHVNNLTNSYNEVVTFLNGGGEYDTVKAENLYTICQPGLVSAETLKATVPSEEYNNLYRNMHFDVLRVFKNATIYRIENGYDPDIYAKTDGGITLVRQKVAEEKNAINSTVLVADIISAYNRWVEFITTADIARNVLSIQTVEDSEIKVQAVCQTEMFASDDILKVTPFIDSVILKNAKVALLDNGELLNDNMGVATAISIRWVRNGVILSGNSIPEKQVQLLIDKDSLGVEFGENIQIARYLGKQQVDFIDFNLVGNDIVITLDKLGEDIESNYSLDFFVLTEGYALETRTQIDDLIPVAITVFGVIFGLWFIFGIINAIKKGRRRKELKEFRKYKKEMKKNR